MKTTQTVRLIDESCNVLATVRVADEGETYGGTIDLSRTPASIRILFEEFEEILNGQMFNFLGEVQEKIAALRIKAVFEDDETMNVEDLQVYPSTRDVSFKRGKVLARRLGKV